MRRKGLKLPHLHVDAGLRFDEFRFDLTDRLVATNSGLNYAGSAEPKVNIVYRPSERVPVAIHLNFGRAVTSQDARGMALDPAAPKVAATNFYMMGTSHNLKRFSASTDMFLIDRQHEDVYDPDNGTMQYQGPSRSYGWEAKASVQLSGHLSWNAGITQVSNAFFLGTSPRQYVDSAPHTVANSSLTLNGVAWVVQLGALSPHRPLPARQSRMTPRFRQLRLTPTRLMLRPADWMWWIWR